MHKLFFGKVCSRFYVKWRYHRITMCIGLSNIAVNRNIVTLMNFMIITLEHFSKHYVNSVPIRSFPGQCLLAFGLNTERHGVSLRVQSECGKYVPVKLQILTLLSQRKHLFWSSKLAGINYTKQELRRSKFY